jgi:hypothetical protein
MVDLQSDLSQVGGVRYPISDAIVNWPMNWVMAYYRAVADKRALQHSSLAFSGSSHWQTMKEWESIEEHS